jgi:predicted O-methyltransferase YrrM
MYQEATKNVQILNKQDQVNIIFGDALEVDNNSLKKYDVIFIDAAKAQYQKFFDKYAPLLKDNGIILTDNIIFHGCVAEQENLSKNVRSMVKKIDMYNHYLNTLVDYNTYYIDSGDGLAITMRKK